MDNAVTENTVDLHQESWDKFIEKANELIDSGHLIEWEVQYKLEIAYRVAAAREAVFWGTDSWADSLKLALMANHPIYTIDHSKFNHWCAEYPEEARTGLSRTS